MAGDFSAAEILDDIFSHCDAVMQNDESANLFPVFLRWDGCDLYIFHAFQVVKEFFQFTRLDVLTSANNHIFDTAGDPVVAAFVFHA